MSKRVDDGTPHASPPGRGRPRALAWAIGVLALAYLTMFGLARTPVVDSESGEAVLWVWFFACVLIGSLAAARVAGLELTRGLASAVGFLGGFLVVGPVVGRAFGHLLPQRPVVFGIALGLQLAVLLPRRGALATTWRVAIPVVSDVIASVYAAPRGRIGVGGIGILLAGLALLAAIEARPTPDDRR